MADLPEGEPAPADGSLPDGDVSGGLSAYVHIPFCQVRCGYCDFNTYTNLQIGLGASVGDFPESLAREMELSARVLTPRPAPGQRLLRTVFFGGGTPTMLRPGQLVSVLRHLDEAFGLARDAEVTTEANPESVTAASLAELAAGGFTRVSFGMQSAVPRVLATLDRQHTPGQVERAVRWARSAGLDVSLDLIYGAPGETMADWKASLECAVACQPDHISAYALTVEPGTKMGAQAARGQIRLPDADEQALKYEVADAALTKAGYGWYEISNWARPGHECRHNAAYWDNGNWWGYGPGAHSHINGTRFWNVKHPLAYAKRLADSTSPAAAREVLSWDERQREDIMLGIRMRQGIAVPAGVGAAIVARLVGDGLVDGRQALRGRLVLTLRGRLLADSVTRDLWV
ncbi:MAG: radical SAM family heme chaperone HemW [Actinomycetaceae bacterium]|nr:radical SAM family heme chaperone HemW [Actinomycetaceae bacterium]